MRQWLDRLAKQIKSHLQRHTELQKEKEQLKAENLEMEQAIKLYRQHAEDHRKKVEELRHANKRIQDKNDTLQVEMERLRKDLSRGWLNPPFEVTEGIVLTSAEVQEAFRTQLDAAGINSTRFRFELLDSNFYIPSLEDAKKILEWCEVDSRKWVRDRTDCDNFGFYLAAMSGMVFGVNPFFPFWDFEGGHVYNLILTPELEVFCLEPQNDQIWNLGERRAGMYVMNSGKIYGF
ncbi:MAG: hypothetical protein DDT33_01543 [Firmicutes bacterium]|nr:hypothetical protein [Bacillota bacterium]